MQIHPLQGWHISTSFEELVLAEMAKQLAKLAKAGQSWLTALDWSSFAAQIQWDPRHGAIRLSKLSSCNGDIGSQKKILHIFPIARQAASKGPGAARKLRLLCSPPIC
jgi:hypothetical protein